MQSQPQILYYLVANIDITISIIKLTHFLTKKSTESVPLMLFILVKCANID